MKIKLLLTIGALLALSNISFAEPVEVIPPQNKILGSSDGRFVFGQISGMRRDQYMLDTQTGQLWQKVKTKDDSIGLQIVPYYNVDGKLSVVPEDIENAVISQLMKRQAKKKKK